GRRRRRVRANPWTRVQGTRCPYDPCAIYLSPFVRSRSHARLPPPRSPPPPRRRPPPRPPDGRRPDAGGRASAAPDAGRQPPVLLEPPGRPGSGPAPGARGVGVVVRAPGRARVRDP